MWNERESHTLQKTEVRHGNMANVTMNSVPELWGDSLPAVQQTAVATKPKAIGWVKMAPDVLRAMAMAANNAGRSLSEVWAEAAREWLLRKSLDADYDVLAHMPAKKRAEDAVLEQKRQRLWGSIDSAMDVIRAPQVAVIEERDIAA
jgi:hypothetical protein